MAACSTPEVGTGAADSQQLQLAAGAQFKSNSANIEGIRVSFMILSSDR